MPHNSLFTNSVIVETSYKKYTSNTYTFISLINRSYIYYISNSIKVNQLKQLEQEEDDDDEHNYY